jgi:ParB family chromosome partitioning protein
MIALVERLTREGAPTREEARKVTARPKPGRPKAFTFTFRPPTKLFNLRLSFKKSRVDRDEVIEALQEIIRELRRQKDQ